MRHEDGNCTLPLVGETIILRVPLRIDVPQVERWLKDPAIGQFLNPEDPISVDPEIQPIRFAFIKERIRTAKIICTSRIILGNDFQADRTSLLYRSSVKPTDLVFAVTKKENEVLVGLIVLRVNVFHCLGTIRTIIAPGNRGKGVGTEAKRLVLKYAFAIGIETAVSETLEHNQATVKINRSLGFTKGVPLQGYKDTYGTPCTVLRMTITRNEFMHTCDSR